MIWRFGDLILNFINHHPTRKLRLMIKDFLSSVSL